MSNRALPCRLGDGQAGDLLAGPSVASRHRDLWPGGHVRRCNASGKSQMFRGLECRIGGMVGLETNYGLSIVPFGGPRLVLWWGTTDAGKLVASGVTKRGCVAMSEMTLGHADRYDLWGARAV